MHSEDFGSGKCKYFGNRGLDLVLNQLGFMGNFFFFFFGILDSCCLDAKKIFNTEIKGGEEERERESAAIILTEKVN